MSLTPNAMDIFLGSVTKTENKQAKSKATGEKAALKNAMSNLGGLL